jgi:hypothetical protein
MFWNETCTGNGSLKFVLPGERYQENPSCFPKRILWLAPFGWLYAA